MAGCWGNHCTVFRVFIKESWGYMWLSVCLPCIKLVLIPRTP